MIYRRLNWCDKSRKVSFCNSNLISNFVLMINLFFFPHGLSLSKEVFLLSTEHVPICNLDAFVLIVQAISLLAVRNYCPISPLLLCASSL